MLIGSYNCWVHFGMTKYHLQGQIMLVTVPLAMFFLSKCVISKCCKVKSKTHSLYSLLWWSAIQVGISRIGFQTVCCEIQMVEINRDFNKWSLFCPSYPLLHPPLFLPPMPYLSTSLPASSVSIPLLWSVHGLPAGAVDGFMCWLVLTGLQQSVPVKEALCQPQKWWGPIIPLWPPPSPWPSPGKKSICGAVHLTWRHHRHISRRSILGHWWQRGLPLKITNWQISAQSVPSWMSRRDREMLNSLYGIPLWYVQYDCGCNLISTYLG